MNPSEEFDQLKGNFGEEGNAHLLTFRQFVALSETRVESLLNRVVDVSVAGRLAELRRDELLSTVQQPQQQS